MTIAGERQEQQGVGRGAPSRRVEAAVAVFATWMIIGLFLDGWSHGVDKPESFFTPWHALLYSGFVAAVGWFAWDGWRQSSRGSKAEAVPGDRWLTVGMALFVAGAVGDGIWHQVFGIEVDLEALLSPTHLLLFIGGFLMGAYPLRIARADRDEVAPAWRAWWPQAVTLTLLTALVGFFTMYLSAFRPVGGGWENSELGQIVGIASVLATNLLFLVPALFVLRRWDPPAGTFVLQFGGAALLLIGLDGFDALALIAPALVGAVALEALRRRTTSLLAVGSGASLALWVSYFAVDKIAFTLVWSVELWAGSIVLAVASSALLASLGEGAPGRR
jgi:hypothetical protein